METELESLIVRLIGDGSSYQQMLNEATASSREAAASVEVSTGRMEEMQGAMNRAADASSVLADETKDLGSKMNDFGTVVTGVHDMMQDTHEVILSLVTAFFAFKGVIAVTDKFQALESTTLRLQAAIRTSGRAVDEVMEKYEAFANQMGEVTTRSAGDILALLQQAEAFGVVGTNAQRAAKNAIAMEAAFGISAEAAIRMTVGLEQGNVMMLKRYIPALRQIKDKEEAIAKAHKILKDSWEAVGAEAESMGGALKQLKNAFEDIMEEIGGIISKGLNPFVKLIKQAIDYVKALDEPMRRWTVGTGVFLAVVGPGVAVLAAFTAIWNRFGKSIIDMSMILVRLINPLARVVGLIKVLTTSFMFFTGPVGLVFVAVAAGLAMVLDHFGGIKPTLEAVETWFSETWESIKTTTTRVLDDLAPVIDGIAITFKIAWSGAKLVVQALWDTIVEGARIAAEWLATIEMTIREISFATGNAIGMALALAAAYRILTLAASLLHVKQLLILAWWITAQVVALAWSTAVVAAITAVELAFLAWRATVLLVKATVITALAITKAAFIASKLVILLFVSAVALAAGAIVALKASIAAASLVISVMQSGMTVLSFTLQAVQATMLLVKAAVLGFTILLTMAKGAATAFSAALAIIKGVATLVASGLVLIGAALTAISFAMGAVVGAAMGVWHALIAVKTVLFNLGSAGPGIKAVGDMFQEWGGIIVDVFNTFKVNSDLAWQLLTAGGKLAIEQLKSLFPPLWKFLKDGFKVLAEMVVNIFISEFEKGMIVNNPLMKLLVGDRAVQRAIETANLTRQLQLNQAQARMNRLVAEFGWDADNPAIRNARAEVQRLSELAARARAGAVPMEDDRWGPDLAGERLEAEVKLEDTLEGQRKAMEAMVKLEATLFRSAEARARIASYSRMLSTTVGSSGPSGFVAPAVGPAAPGLPGPAAGGGGGVGAGLGDREAVGLLRQIKDHLAVIAAKPEVKLKLVDLLAP